MMSKVLFLVLVGCALVLAKPALRNDEVSNEVEVPKVSTEVENPKESIEVEIIEVDEEKLKEIFKAIEKKVNELIQNATEQFNSDDFQEAFAEIQKITEQIFDQTKQ